MPQVEIKLWLLRRVVHVRDDELHDVWQCISVAVMYIDDIEWLPW